ncbi:MAG: ATP-binding protein [Sphingosinicella sp.]|uniref:ATP-binding protein n=1 Tax=Sphingosinicella sp. TaxID=1917971 RepID=UPI0040376C25
MTSYLLVGFAAALLGAVIALALGRRASDEQQAPAGAAADVEPGDPRASLLAAFEEPVLIVRDRKVAAANDAARALLGAHIEGVDVRLAIRHPAAAERLAGPPADPAQEEKLHAEIIGLGEASRPWLMSVAPLGDGSRLVRLVDQSQARAAEQMRVDFVANASHELRTPLATLLGFLETLQDDEAGGDAETRARFLKIMFDEATRMRDLLDDLMSLSRIEAERFALPRETVDLVSLVEQAKVALKPLLSGRKLVLENEASGARVAGDRGQLAQLLNNLLVNALKYGRPGTPVRVRIAPDGEMVRLSVIDQGEGIEAEHIPRLTERFYRVDASRSRQVGGTGLGLAIVKHIVLRHRGRLEIASTIGTGTEVSVYLPRADVTETS